MTFHVNLSKPIGLLQSSGYLVTTPESNKYYSLGSAVDTYNVYTIFDNKKTNLIVNSSVKIAGTQYGLAYRSESESLTSPVGHTVSGVSINTVGSLWFLGCINGFNSTNIGELVSIGNSAFGGSYNLSIYYPSGATPTIKGKLQRSGPIITDLDSGVLVELDKLYLIQLNFTNTTLELYVNGILTASSSFAGGTPTRYTPNRVTLLGSLDVANSAKACILAWGISDSILPILSLDNLGIMYKNNKLPVSATPARNIASAPDASIAFGPYPEVQRPSVLPLVARYNEQPRNYAGDSVSAPLSDLFRYVLIGSDQGSGNGIKGRIYGSQRILVGPNAGVFRNYNHLTGVGLNGSGGSSTLSIHPANASTSFPVISMYNYGYIYSIESGWLCAVGFGGGSGYTAIVYYTGSVYYLAVYNNAGASEVITLTGSVRTIGFFKILVTINATGGVTAFINGVKYTAQITLAGPYSFNGNYRGIGTNNNGLITFIEAFDYHSNIPDALGIELTSNRDMEWASFKNVIIPERFPGPRRKLM